LKLLFAVDRKRFFLINQFVDELRRKGIDCLVIDDLDIYDKDDVGSKYLKWIGSPKKLEKILLDFQPNMIFTERVSHFSSLIIKKNLPLIIFLRGDYWREVEIEKNVNNNLNKFNVENIVKQKLAEKCFKNSTLILPICKYLEEIVKNRYPEKAIHVMYQGIDESDWFYEKNSVLNHPCVGLIQDANVWGKTKEMLILSNVLERLPDVNFYWAGDGKYRERITDALKKYNNFHWIGRLEYPNEVRKFLSEIDVYALLSGMDMSPHTLLEAGLMKKPIIATNVGGINESCKNNETCFLIEKNNSDEWIKKISFLLNDEIKMKEIGNKGYDYVKKNFLWSKIADDFIQILNRMNKH